MRASRRPLMAVAAAATVALAAAWLWPHNMQPSQKDRQTMQTFTEHMTTHCVGRLLIDAPAGANPGEGSYGFQIAEIKPVQKSPQPVEDRLRRLDRELAEREIIQRTQKDAYGDPIAPAKLYQPAANVRSIWYIADPSAEVMDGYVLRPDGTFVFNTNAYDQHDIQEFNDFLLQIEPALSVRENSTIPTTPGFCINDGFIAMKPEKRESASLAWDLPGHPDVRFSLGTQSNDDEVPEGHLDRESETVAQLGALMNSVKTLRKRRFEFLGMPAQEWSVEFTDQPQFDFRIEIPGEPNDKAKPFITLSMVVGNALTKIKPSLTTGEAIALWDAVIQTLRPRPGAV